MTVGRRDVGRLPVGALKRKQGAHTAAPAALTLQEHPTGEGEGDDHREYDGHRGTVAVQTGDACTGNAEEQAGSYQEPVAREPIRRGACAAEPGDARKLIRRRERAYVAPHSWRDEEQRWPQRHDDVEEHEQ